MKTRSWWTPSISWWKPEKHVKHHIKKTHIELKNWLKKQQQQWKHRWTMEKWFKTIEKKNIKIMEHSMKTIGKNKQTWKNYENDPDIDKHHLNKWKPWTNRWKPAKKSMSTLEKPMNKCKCKISVPKCSHWHILAPTCAK